MDQIRKQIEESINLKKLVLSDDSMIKAIKTAADLCVDSLKDKHKILFAGNGGSAADAQHLAAELVNKFGFDRPGLAAIALTTDTSILTSISNDYGFLRLFARQIESLGQKGDILIAFSTSGSSANILEGIREAQTRGIKVIGFSGQFTDKMSPFCDVCISVPSLDTPRIQEIHIMIGHIICWAIENKMFGRTN
jgi:D-sedoheptulose 7-phosphate isomerase